MTEPLTVEEEDLWRAFARLMTVLPRALDERMQRDTGLIKTTYLVLMHLSEAPDRSLRMNELAARSAMSPSRMTRIVDDLERDGYVARGLAAGDRRVSVARLTPSGLRLLKRAWPGHLRTARELVVDQVEPAERAQVAAALHRILDGLGCAEVESSCPGGAPSGCG